MYVSSPVFESSCGRDFQHWSVLINIFLTFISKMVQLIAANIVSIWGYNAIKLPYFFKEWSCLRKGVEVKKEEDLK